MPVIGVCGDQTLEPVNFNDCEPEILLSEIRRIFIAKVNAEVFSNVYSAVEWNARLDQETTTGDNYIRALTVIGDRPGSTDTRKEISDGRTMLLRKSHTLNATVDDISAENHTFMQSIEGGVYVRLWYETHAGKIYGGNAGIVMLISAQMVLARGKDEIKVWNILGAWDNLKTEDFGVSPIFNLGSNAGGALDTTLTFTAAVADSDAGVTGTAPAIDAELQFSFDAISPTIGLPATMLLKVHVGGAPVATLQLTIDFPMDYIGADFIFIDAQGESHNGTFQVGDVEFTN